MLLSSCWNYYSLLNTKAVCCTSHEWFTVYPEHLKKFSLSNAFLCHLQLSRSLAGTFTATSFVEEQPDQIKATPFSFSLTTTLTTQMCPNTPGQLQKPLHSRQEKESGLKWAITGIKIKEDLHWIHHNIAMDKKLGKIYVVFTVKSDSVGLRFA